MCGRGASVHRGGVCGNDQAILKLERHMTE